MSSISACITTTSMQSLTSESPGTMDLVYICSIPVFRGQDSATYCIEKRYNVHPLLCYTIITQIISFIRFLVSALAALYQKEARFQLQRIDDAAEAFEAVLARLHTALAPTGRPEADKDPCPCMSHSVFGLDTVQQVNASFTLYPALPIACVHYHQPSQMTSNKTPNNHTVALSYVRCQHGPNW